MKYPWLSLISDQENCMTCPLVQIFSDLSWIGHLIAYDYRFVAEEYSLVGCVEEEGLDIRVRRF